MRNTTATGSGARVEWRSRCTSTSTPASATSATRTIAALSSGFETSASVVRTRQTNVLTISRIHAAPTEAEPANEIERTNADVARGAARRSSGAAQQAAANT